MTLTPGGATELLQCPFCGKLPGTKVGPPAMARCVTDGCEGLKLAAVSVAEWNTRPSPDSKLEAYRKALASASTQCGNVIFNCEQRPADNDRHLSSWRGVKEYIDAALSATPKQPE